MIYKIGSNKEDETFISVLDFLHNEILVTTVMNIGFSLVKWNYYLKNLEFCTLSNKVYTFWRVNSDASLQYQHGDFEHNLINGRDKYFSTIEYTPPLSITCTILVLIGLSNGEIWGVDTKTNSIAVKFSPKVHEPIKSIICSLKYISIIYNNCVKYFKLPFLRDIQHDELNLFTNKEEDIILDSEIISYDIDLMKSNSIALTSKGILWCINYDEKISVRLFSFFENITDDSNNKIIQTKLINKDYQYYSVRKVDFDNLKMEELSPEIKENQYFLITGHKNGTIRIWSIPEYNLLMNFTVITEELICFDTTPNDLKLVASYSEFLRFFDIADERFLGKYKPISSQAFKHIQFLPDGQFMFCIDMNNTIFLLKIEKFDPLLINIHQLFNLSGDIYQFKINPLENYNKFLINLQNVYLCVYNRKFTNILRNLSYDSSVPQFYLQDKFNVDEHLRNEVNMEQDKNLHNKIFENFNYEFCTNDKSLVYVLSEGRKLVIIRNYELHTNVKMIKFPYNPINFSISPNSAFVVYLFKDFVRLNQLGEEKGLNIDLLSKGQTNITISLNSKLLVINSKNSLSFYDIKYI